MAARLLRSSLGQVLRSASAIVSKTVSGSHVLRIDGYSHLKQAIDHGKGIESCDFGVGGHTWRLECYPNGNRSESHIALFLKLVSDSQDEPVRAQSQFSLLDQLGKPVLPHETGMQKFSRGNSWGFHEFISKDELEKSEYLKDDRFTIQCNVSVTTVRKCTDNWAFISQDLESGGLYKLLKARNGQPQPTAKFIWSSKAPPRVQLFMWLLVQGRIQCRSNLLRKHIVDSPVCEVCGLQEETPGHIMASCGFAVSFWAFLGINFDDADSMASNLHTITCPSHIPALHFQTLIALCCWQLWKRRNNFVFNQVTDDLRTTLILCKKEAQLWKARLPRKDGDR